MEQKGPGADPRVLAEAENTDGPLAKGMAFFSVRLLRKAYRPGRRGPSCPPDVKDSEASFLRLLETVRDEQPHPREEWHKACEAFSKEWAHVCHWIHPSRLADYLSDQLGFKWTGEPPPRKVEEVKEPRAAVRAQKFRCMLCNVTCNSYTQYEIHAQGTKHIDLVAQRQRAAVAQGREFQQSEVAAVPVGNDGEVDPQMSYYHRAEGERDGLSSSSTGSRTPPSSPKGGKKGRSSGEVTPKLAAHLAVAAFSINAVGGSTGPAFNSAGTGPAQGWYQEPSQWAYGEWRDGYCGMSFNAGAWNPEHEQCAANWNSPASGPCTAGMDDDDDDDDDDDEPRVTGYFPCSPSVQSTWADYQALPPPVATQARPESVRPPTYYTPPDAPWQYEYEAPYQYYAAQEGGWYDADLELTATGSATESTVPHTSDVEDPTVSIPISLRYRAHEGIERGLLGGESAQDEVLKAVSEEGVEVAAQGLVHAAASGKAKEVAALLRGMGDERIARVVAEEAEEAVGLGPQVRELHEAMGEEESEFAEQANGRELLRYAGVLALGVLLACTESGGLGLVEAGHLLRKYVAGCEAAGVEVPKCATAVAADAVRELSGTLEAGGAGLEGLDLLRELRSAQKECVEHRLHLALSDAAGKASASARFLQHSFSA